MTNLYLLTTLILFFDFIITPPERLFYFIIYEHVFFVKKKQNKRLIFYIEYAILIANREFRRGVKMYEDLSNKQIEILNFIREAVSKKGYPPAVREICEAVGLKSTSTVHGHLTKIEQKGYIKRDPTKPRAIEIIDTMNNGLNLDMSTSYVPVVGQVTAGEPILAVENLEENFPVPSEFMADGEYFMLRITGDSMIEAGILDRDYVLVKQQNEANNGDTVVALVEDSATVKTFYKEKNQVRLQPENPTMDPMYFDTVEILGLVKGVFRKM